KGAGFIFENGDCYKNEQFMKVLDSYGDKCILTYDDQPKLIFDCKWLMNAQKFNMLRDFLYKMDKTL
ncbi:MAG: hypothetical protein RR348_02265, partial [Clostridia bacterium]